jgi:hypothetical protein
MIEARIAFLTRGKRGQVLNVESSTPAEALFNRPAIVNLSRFGSGSDKALVMAMLLAGACEYRRSCYELDRDGYQEKARDGQLQHLLVVEEAHTVLRRPEPSLAGTGNPHAVVAEMFSDMLAEVRQYGQGLLVIDQDPARLIDGTIKNTSFRIVHKLPHEGDRAALSAVMNLQRAEQREFLGMLPNGHAIVSTENDDSPCWVFINGSPGTAEEERAAGGAAT